MAVKSHPFPPRNAQFPYVHQILFEDIPVGSPDCKPMYKRSQGAEARLARFQYVGIEEELERSFRYVSPSDENADAFSLKFAEIIHLAANAYEIMARELYTKFYNDKDEINIFNYLALELYLQLTDQTVSHLAALGDFPGHPEVCRPFARLGGWDKASLLDDGHVPRWWTAYNKVKHSNHGLRHHATLANAMAATAAVFLLTERVYGFGILQGGFFATPDNPFGLRDHPRWSRLFVRL